VVDWIDHTGSHEVVLVFIFALVIRL